MIKIIQYPETVYHLGEFINTIRRDQRSEMQMVWQYNSDDALEVFISFRATEASVLEQLLCADLSANGYLYLNGIQTVPVLTPDADANGNCLRHFFFIPESNVVPSELSPGRLSVLLSAILKSHGRLSVLVLADTTGVCAAVSADVSYPYAINHAFAHCFKTGVMNGQGDSFFAANDDMLAMITQLPALADENANLITGFGHRQATVAPAAIDVVIGQIVGDALGRTLLLTQENETSSTIVTGISGYGKTTLVKSLISQSYRKRHVPFLVIEPAKNEYQDLKKLIPETEVISDLSGYSFLIPPKGMPVHLWSDVVARLIATAMNIPADSSLSAHYRAAFELCSRKELTPKLMISAFRHLTKQFAQRHLDYCLAGADTLENFFRYFNGPDYAEKTLKPFPMETIVTNPVIINLGYIPSPQQKTTYLLFLIKHLQAYLMQQKQTQVIDHLLVLEEAHHILGKDLPAQLQSEVTSILRESRAQALQTILADQSPSALSEQALSQAGNVISLRLTSGDDQTTMASSLLCDPKELNLLPKYTCECRLNQMTFPTKVRIDAREVLC